MGTGRLPQDVAHNDEALEPARAIAREVADAGGRAWVVGGFVRDRLLGLDPKDLDLEVFGIPAADLPALLARFGQVEPVGQSFPVYKVGAIDVALPRRESKTGHGHKGFTVEGDPSMSFADAARRRDFTVNAIGLDPLTGEHADPFGGRDDLAGRRLRVVDPARFGDDSLRVLRAVQLVGRFSLQVDTADARRAGRHPARRFAGRAYLGRDSTSSCCAPPRRRRGWPSPSTCR